MIFPPGSGTSGDALKGDAVAAVATGAAGAADWAADDGLSPPHATADATANEPRPSDSERMNDRDMMVGLEKGEVEGDLEVLAVEPARADGDRRRDPEREHSRREPRPRGSGEESIEH